MRRARLLIGFFLLATVLVDLTVLAVRPNMGIPDPTRSHTYGDVIPAAGSECFGAVVWGLYLSQVSAAAIWLALGLSAAPLRFIAVFGIVLVWNAAICVLTQQGEDLTFGMIFTGMTALAVAVPLFAARQFGLRLAHWCDGELHEIAPSGAERWQFSLLNLFALTTVLAVFLGMLKFIFINDVVWASVREQLRVVSSGNLRCQVSIVMHAIVAWGALWIALGNRRRLRMGLAIAVIAAILGTCLSLSLCPQWYHQSSSWRYRSGSFWWHFGWRNDDGFEGWIGPWTLAALFFLEASLLLGSLWIFRLAGYRVVFRRSVAEEGEGGEE